MNNILNWFPENDLYTKSKEIEIHALLHDKKSKDERNAEQILAGKRKMRAEALENALTKFNRKINGKVLEIGAGSEPHLKYVEHSYKQYFFLETSKFAINLLKKKFKNNKKIKFKVYDGKKIPYKSNYFDRIVISHVLEHIPDPEIFLREMMMKLKKNGILSIALPIDPGFLWRLGRFFLKLHSVKKKYNISNLEYDYMIASEHINSIFNLISIIKYNYKDNIVSEKY